MPFMEKRWPRMNTATTISAGCTSGSTICQTMRSLLQLSPPAAIVHTSTSARREEHDMTIHEPFRLPADLQRWGWIMQQMTSGPRKNPGDW